MSNPTIPSAWQTLAVQLAQGRWVAVLRGVSGSGKSTLATFLTQHALGETAIFSADHYFTAPDGSYAFDPDKLPDAHAACLRAFAERLPEGLPSNQLLVVDNTNTTIAEAAPYMALAAAYGWSAVLVDLEASWRLAAARNTHEVPLRTVEAQHARLVLNEGHVPPYWPALVLPSDLSA